ncbi:hypothetical protein DSO57_1011685 [Entomophthora muscae]|uniref:Uncharacterized protein n=1 Tax=Entomophthora muscae TaxID=34485 RepID=A0ACC2TTZ5_9FUNG|nr:hypothetical protein DSO57_1011685 [Entomophthora muscae]
MISAVSQIEKQVSRRNKPTRRNRGPNARGPRPQVCDLCQLRKVKCDRAVPRCSLCQKLKKPCTYDRNGFDASYGLCKTASEEGDHSTGVFSTQEATIKEAERWIERYVLLRKTFSDPKLPHGVDTILTSSSRMAVRRSNVLLGSRGDYIYIGPSMATHYFTSNRRLLSMLSTSFVAVVEPLHYNRGISVDFTKTLTMQLVELYFAYLNSFYPILDPTVFYSQLHRGCVRDDFLALLHVVCLTGASFYPNRTLGRIIAKHFSRLASLYLKKIFFKPSLTAAQACVLATLHISVCDESTTIEGAWFVMGVAKLMTSLMGIPHKRPHSTPSHLDSRCRLWWMMYATDQTISQCSGRPLSSDITPSTVLPRQEAPLPSLNFTNQSVFLVKEVTMLRSSDNLKYFCEFCAHTCLIAKRIHLKELHEESYLRSESVGNFSLSMIVNGLKSHPRKQTYLESSKKLERESIAWYLALPEFSTPKREASNLYLPYPKDVHLGMLSIFFFSMLIDLNKPFIKDSQQVSCLRPSGKSLSLNRYLCSNALEKCILASFFGCQVFIDQEELILEVGLPYVWYCAIQFFFLFNYMVHKLPPDHWAVAPARRNALFLFQQFEKNSDRWAILRDSYFMIKPFMEKIRSPALN